MELPTEMSTVCIRRSLVDQIIPKNVAFVAASALIRTNVSNKPTKEELAVSFLHLSTSIHTYIHNAIVIRHSESQPHTQAYAFASIHNNGL